MEKPKAPVITYEQKDLETIAKNQKIIIWLFIAAVVLAIAIRVAPPVIADISVPLAKMFALLILVLQIGAGVGLIVWAYITEKGLKGKYPLLYSIGILLPLIVFVAIGSLIVRSTKVLKANNIKVGLFGAQGEK